MKKYLTLVLSLVLLSFTSQAATWYSAPAGGDASVLANWWSTAGGTGTNPTSFTTPGDVWTIQSTMTCGNTNFTIGGTLSITSGQFTGPTGTVNIGGDFDISGGELNAAGALSINLTGNLNVTGSGYLYNSPSYTQIYFANTASTYASPQTITWSSSASNEYVGVFINAGCYVQLLTNVTLPSFDNTTEGISGTLICGTYNMNYNGNSMTVNAGATIYTANTGGLNGSITTSGGVTFSGSANYIFNGTTQQVTGTYLPTSLSDTLTINNTAGVTMSGNATTTGILELTNGILHTGSFTMGTPGTPGAVIGASATNYVAGSLSKTITGFTTINYEVGDTDYAPMQLTFDVAATAGSIGVRCSYGFDPNQATSAVSSSQIVNHYWTITNSGAAGPATVSPKATYNLTDILGGSNANFLYQKYSSGAWLGSPLPATNTSTPYTSTPATSIALASLAGDYIFGYSAPCVGPSAQPTNLTLTPTLYTIMGSFTAAAPAPDNYLVVMTTTSAAPTTPVDGTLYTAGATALGGTIVSVSSATTFTVTGLPTGTPYWFWIYSYNSSCTGGPLYLTTSPLTTATSTTTCAISGIKTVGPTGDYPTIAAAVASLTALGQAGPVALEIQTTYTGEAYPITIGPIPCSSPVNNLTIRPQGTMTIAGNTATPMFDLNGAQWVTIDGRVGSTGTTKALTILDSNVLGMDIRFINDASTNVVEYCTLQGSYYTGSTTNNQGTVLFSTGVTTGNDNNRIDNCDLLDGPINTPQVAIMSLGTNGKENDNDTVSNCNIANFFSAAGATDGILLSTGTSTWTITNNKFYQTVARAYTGNTQRAIYISNTTSGQNFTITGNTIGYSSNTGTGTDTMTSTGTMAFQGIYFNAQNNATVTPSSIQGNIIAAISFSTTSATNVTGGFLCGIDIASGSVNVGNITPNVIGSGTGTGSIYATSSGNGGAIVGITTSAASPAIVNIQNNIIGSITDTGTTAAKATGVEGIQATSTAAVTISGNTIGSTTTPNSMNAANIATVTTAQLAYGINVGVTVPCTISNNTIANLSSSQTSTSGLTSGILCSSSGADTIINNTINNISGASANVSVTGQTGVSGISCTSTGGTDITLNTINTISNTNANAVQSNVSGIGVSGANNGFVQRNKVYDLRSASIGSTVTTPPTAVGILCGAPGAGGITIQNNFISLGSSQSNNTEFVGIENSANNASNPLRIYYNSIDIEGTVTTGALPSVCIHRGNNTTTAFTTPVSILNNICVNNRTGGTTKNYAIANGLNVVTANAAGWGLNASNYNILNATNTATIGYWSGDQTFATWQTASASDHNSYSATPVVFTDVPNDDLHINMGTTPNNIESHAIAISTITTDYDNQVRPGPQPSINGGGTTPDIGADEFDGVPIDNLPPVINYTALMNTCNNGDVTFTGNVVDSSGIPLAGSGTEPRVYYRKTSFGAWFSHPATLSSGTQNNGNWFFDIVAADMGGVNVGDTIFYYVIAQDDLGNVGSNPSVGLVASNVNSVTTAPTTPNFYLIAEALSGTYTVGAAGNFTTLTQAVNIYNVACLNGPVIFQLTDATYPNETFPITVNLNPEANSTNTLTIEPAPGIAASITGTTATTAVIKMLNARYITVDGLNTGGSSLALTNINTNANTADIWLASTATTGPGCRHIALNNMTLTNGTISTASSWNIISGADAASPSTNAGPDNDTVTIHGNTFLEAGYAIYTKGTTAVSAGGFDNWSIDSNIIGPATYSTTTNMGYNAMFLQGMVNASVTNNTIQNIGLTTSSSQTVGIYLSSNITGIVIDKNNINNVVSDVSNTGTSSVCGIYLGGAVLNTTITQNNLNNILTESTGGYSGHGIIVNTGSNTSNTLIANNFISNIFGSSYAVNIGDWEMGIDLEGSSGGIKVYYNTIDMNSSYPGYNSATISTALMVNTTGNNIDVQDNIFANTFDNTTVTNEIGYAIYSTAASSAFSTIDYNDYYAFNSNASDVLGYIAGTNQATLAAIQSSFGGNTHSINTLPTFVSTTDLHLQVVGPNVPLISGTPLVAVTTDIDGTARSATTPVMGAHEVAISGCFNVTIGTVTATQPAFCVTGVDTLSESGATQAAGLAYEWESSADSMTNWTVIPTATNFTYMPTVTATTYYRVIITCITSGQSDSGAVKVKINPLPVIAVTPTGGGYCSGAGSVTMTASGAETYIWSPAAGLTSTNTASVIASPVATTFYTVTGTDTNGCQNIHVDTIAVTNTPPPVVITPNIDTFCSGNSVMLTAVSALPDSIMFMDFNSGLGAWTIDNSGTSTTVQFAVQSDGYVEPGGGGYGPFHTPDNSSMLVAVVDLINGNTQTIANSPAFSLAGYNSASLSFETTYDSYFADEAVEVDISVNGGAWATLQNYLGTSIGGVANFSTETVDLSPYIGQSNCQIRFKYYSDWGFYWAIDNVAITGSGSYTNITWAPNANLYNDAGLTTPYAGAVLDTVYTAPTVTTQTTYSYTATATNGGCTDTGTTKLTVVPALVVDTLTGGGSYCIGGSGVVIGLNTSTSGISYQLYYNNTGAPVGAPVPGTGSAITFGSQDSAGTYYVVATNGYCNSTMTDSATVIINPLPTVNPITGPDSVCVNSAITLVDTSGGGTGAWTSVYTGTATVTGGGVVTGVAAGTDTIKYAVTNSCGTTTVDTTITVNPLPVPVITAGGVANLSLNTGAYASYQWFVGGNPITGATNQTDSAMQNGNYTVEVTDSNGCMGTSAPINVTTVGVPNIISYTGSVTIYPNPNNGTFVISGSIYATDNKAQIEITNVAGQVILRDDADISKGTINKQVKLDPYLASGMYHVKIVSDRQTFVLPFVKQ